MSRRVLIACAGNIFLGDDGFGVEVARRLAGRALPEGAVVRDFGIRGFDLACALLDGYDVTILVDACPRGAPPGTLYLIEPGPVDDAPALLEMHAMDPVSVLRTVRAMGGEPGRMLVVGCEPADLESEGLSDPVAAAVDGAVALIENLAQEALACA
jgi:hydrogenase maturation protease